MGRREEGGGGEKEARVEEVEKVGKREREVGNREDGKVCVWGGAVGEMKKAKGNKVKVKNKSGKRENP